VPWAATGSTVAAASVPTAAVEPAPTVETATESAAVRCRGSVGTESAIEVAGALLAHLGLGLSFSNWFALGFSTIPYFLAAAYRMRVEEQALREAFGVEYLEYSKTVKRPIPKLY